MKQFYRHPLMAFLSVAALVGCGGSSSSSGGAPAVAQALCSGTAVTPERVFLQQLSHDSVIIKWRSAAMDRLAGNEATAVCIGTKADALPESSLTAATVTETNHSEALITGLKPDTQYFYSIGGAAEATPGFSFRTAPRPDSLPSDGNIRVWVVGDPGTASSPLLDRGTGAQALVRDGFLTWSTNNGAEPADLFLMLGDNAYLDGTDDQFQTAVFDLYGDILASTGMWPTIGNHEMGSGGTSTADSVALYTPGTGAPDPGLVPMPYLNIHSLPTQAEMGGIPSGTEQYYSFDYGNLHVISLDSQVSTRNPDNLAAMLSWVTSDLQANTKDWTIVIFHHPPYTKGSHDSDDNAGGVDDPIFVMREQFNPVFEAHGVDLVYGGHSHSYERSFYINGHHGLSTSFDPAVHAELNSAMQPASGQGAEAYEQITSTGADDKVIYTVAGNSGQATGMSDENGHPAHFFSTGDLLGSVVVDISRNTLTATFIDETGVEHDYFTISR